jgi:hypothetical membrane protein
MTTIAGAVPVRTRALPMAWASDLRIAGASMFAAGALLVMAIITCEALYPFAYSTARNEISDLGGTKPPAALVFQPVATIFNVSMIVTGLLLLLGAVVLQRNVRRWSVSLPALVLGGAVLLVGIFPGNTGLPHAVSAMVAFWAGGIAAVLTSRIVTGPFRYALMLLGAINLLLLVSYFTLGDSNPMWVLGVGGAERWIAYPILLWAMGFGGYLAGRGASIASSGR